MEIHVALFFGEFHYGWSHIAWVNALNLISAHDSKSVLLHKAEQLIVCIHRPAEAELFLLLPLAFSSFGLSKRGVGREEHTLMFQKHMCEEWSREEEGGRRRNGEWGHLSRLIHKVFCSPQFSSCRRGPMRLRTAE